MLNLSIICRPTSLYKDLTFMYTCTSVYFIRNKKPSSNLKLKLRQMSELFYPESIKRCHLFPIRGFRFDDFPFFRCELASHCLEEILDRRIYYEIKKLIKKYLCVAFAHNSPDEVLHYRANNWYLYLYAT